MVSSSDIRPMSVIANGNPLGSLIFVFSVACAIVVFWSGVMSLVDAWAIPEYSHGPIIPLLSLFMFMREMREVQPVSHPVTDRWQGVVLLSIGLIFGVIGNLVRIDDIVTYALIIWLAGMVLVNFGFRRGLIFWPAVLHLVFMLPLPQFLYWQVSIYLQMVSSQIGVGLIALFGIPVYLDGNIIDLGVYKLQVAEACSGLRYLFPMLSFSYVFAVLYNGPMWHKAVLLVSAAPITIAMNSFRIGMIGVLVNSYGIEHAEGFLHTFEGWIIFVACVCILFLLAILLQHTTRNPRRLADTLDIEFAGLDRELKRVTAIVPSAALMVGAALTLATAIGWWTLPERAVIRPDREPLVFFPLQFGDMTARTQTLDSEIRRILAADDYLSAAFSDGTGAPPVDLFMAYYHSQTDGSGIHSPEVCIPAGGWEVSRWERVPVTLDSGVTVTVNRATIQQGINLQIVYFWFEQRGRRLTSDYAAKIYTVMDSLTMGRSDGGLVRLITPVSGPDGEAAADERLRSFMEYLVPALPRFMPD